MAQGRSTKITTVIQWIRTSRLSIKHSLSRVAEERAVAQGAKHFSRADAIITSAVFVPRKFTPVVVRAVQVLYVPFLAQNLHLGCMMTMFPGHLWGDKWTTLTLANAS